MRILIAIKRFWNTTKLWLSMALIMLIVGTFVLTSFQHHPQKINVIKSITSNIEDDKINPITGLKDSEMLQMIIFAENIAAVRRESEDNVPASQNVKLGDEKQYLFECFQSDGSEKCNFLRVLREEYQK